MRLAVILSALLFAQPVCAQQLDPDTPPAVIRTGPLAQQRLTIPIHIGDLGPWNFIVDTGSQRTVVSRALADRLALKPAPDVTILSMTGRSIVSSVELPKIAFGAGDISDIQAPVLEEYDLGAPGILGLDGLQSKRLLLDFRKGHMAISSSRKRVPVDPDTIIVEARRRNGQLILFDSQVNGTKVSIILDTGSDYSIGNMALYAKLAKRKRAPALIEGTVHSVTGGLLTGKLGMIDEMRMGQVRLKDFGVLFADAPPFAALGLDKKPAMLLGIGTLRVFDRVAIDFGRGRVDFLLPDEGARAGFQLAALDSAALPSSFGP